MLRSNTVFGNFKKKSTLTHSVRTCSPKWDISGIFFKQCGIIYLHWWRFPFVFHDSPRSYIHTHSSDSAHKKESREPRCSLTLVYVISYQSLGAGVWDRLWLLLFWIPPAFCWHHDDAVKKAKTKKPIPIGSRMRFPHNRWIRCMNCWHLGTFSTFFKRVLAINCVHTTNEVRRFFFMFGLNGRERALAQMSEKAFRLICRLTKDTLQGEQA